MHVLIDSTMLQLWPAVRQGLPGIAFITDIHRTHTRHSLLLRPAQKLQNIPVVSAGASHRSF
jgi:hypothetical protein